jgi:hypothetical protein
MVTAIALLAFATTSMIRRAVPVSNPAKVHYDTSRDIPEVYNEKEDLLVASLPGY